MNSRDEMMLQYLRVEEGTEYMLRNRYFLLFRSARVVPLAYCFGLFWGNTVTEMISAFFKMGNVKQSFTALVVISYKAEGH